MRSSDPAEWLVPVDRLAALESYILKHAPDLAGPMLTNDDITSGGLNSLCVGTISHCLGNLSHEWDPGDVPWLAIVETDKINAMIARVDGEVYVVVSTALYAAVGMSVHAVLLDPQFVEFIRDGAIPVDDVTDLAKDRRAAIATLLERAVTDRCPAPDLHAAITTLACYFLAAHEMGHLAQGHLERDGAPGFAVEADQADVENRAESRCLEWNADVFAAIATTYLTGSESWRPVFSNPAFSLRCFVAATYLLFSFMDLSNDNARDRSVRTHPEPMVRVGVMSMALTSALGFGGRMTQEEALEIMQATIRALEIAIGRIGGGMLDEDRRNKVIADAFATLDEIGAVWPELKAKLNTERTKPYMWAAFIP
jgi:hypothetical protein